MQSVRFDDSAYQSAIDIVALDTDYGRNHFEVFTFDLPPGPPRWQLSAIMALDPRLGRDALHRCRLFRRGFGCGAYRGEQGGQATLDSLSQAIPTFHALSLSLSRSQNTFSLTLLHSLSALLLFSLLAGLQALTLGPPSLLVLFPPHPPSSKTLKWHLRTISLSPSVLCLFALYLRIRPNWLLFASPASPVLHVSLLLLLCSSFLQSRKSRDTHIRAALVFQPAGRCRERGSDRLHDKVGSGCRLCDFGGVDTAARSHCWTGPL